MRNCNVYIYIYICVYSNVHMYTHMHIYIHEYACIYRMCSLQPVLCAVFGLCHMQSLILCYVKSLVCVMCSVQPGVCAVCILRHQVMSSVMCSLQSVLRVVLSLCYVQLAVMNLVASFRACLASLGRKKKEGPEAMQHVDFFVHARP